MSSSGHGVAIVMTGGGARAAYQVGFLRYLARAHPTLQVSILTGVSAGAINAAYLASHEGSFAEAVEALCGLWERISPDRVFRTDLASLAGSVLRWSAGLLSGGSRLAPPRPGFMDTAPLRELLLGELPNQDGELVVVRRNVAEGRLRALAITTTNYGTGQSITWVQGDRIQDWVRPHRRSRGVDLTVNHIMASAALPLIFPAVRLADGWHGDGGIRLTAPLSPAMHLGASKILAISNRYHKNQVEAETSAIHGYPPPAQVVGTLLNAMFLDMLDFDAQNVVRINDLIDRLPVDARGAMRPIRTLVLRPSRDLGRLAASFEVRLPRTVRFFTRGFGTRDTDAPDSLSLLMFHPGYIRGLIALGETDAEARGEEIERFLEAGE